MQTAGLEAPKNSPQVPRSAFAQSKWFIEGGPGYGPQRNSLCSTYTFAGIQSSPRQNCNWRGLVRHLTGLVNSAAINGADPDYVLYWNDENFAVAKKVWSDYSFDFHLLKSLEKCGKREHKSAH